MPALTWATHHRLLMMGMGITILLSMIAAGIWFFVLRSPGTQIDLSQAIRLYRQGQRSGNTGGDSRLHPSGVYRYRTSGSEQLSIGGISRTFPTDTDMIVTDDKCSTLTWEPFEQHVEGLVECPLVNGATSIMSAPNYEDIAGIRTTSVIRCPASAYLIPPDPIPGTQWHTTCDSGGQRIAFSGQFLGLSSVAVGRRQVPALHARTILRFSGSQSGTSPSDYWISAQNGIILRQRETVDLVERSGPFGSVHYFEEMTIGLASMEPVR
jgi:hypothetical protein